MNYKVEKDVFGLTVSATVVMGDWEGDPDVPRGVHYLPPTLEDVEIQTPDGTDIYDWVTDEGVEFFETALMEDE